MNISSILEAFSTLELDLPKEVEEFILYSIYLKSESIEKMKYGVLLDMIEG